MYILAHRFGEITYYVKCYADKFEEIYNPEFATNFETKAKAINWSKNNTTFGEYAVALDKDTEVLAFQKWCSHGMIRRTIDLINKKYSRKYNNEGKLEVLDWHINQSNIRYEDFATWPALYSTFKNIWNVLKYENKEISFEMAVHKDSSFETFVEELNLVLPHITFIDDNGYKIISIIDHGLGAGGNFSSFLYKSDEDCAITGRFSSPQKEGNLREVFDYWKRVRWMHGGNEEEE